MNQRIVTTDDVNIRSGPSIMFDVVDVIRTGTTLVATEVTKESNGLTWYKTDKGWICGRYVTLATDAAIKFNKEKGQMVRAATGGAGTADGMTREVTRTDRGQLMTQARGGGAGIAGSITGSMGGLSQDASGLANVATMDNFLSRRIFGLPYQFMPTTDFQPGPDGTDGQMGIAYAQAMSEAAILSYIPGKPMFLPDMDDKSRQGLFQAMNDLMSGLSERIEAARAKLDEDSFDVPFFSFTSDYTTYSRYVDTLCQMNAIMMGIGNKQVPGTIPGERMKLYDSADGGKEEDDNTFRHYKWSRFSAAQLLRNRPTTNPENSVQDLSDAAENILAKFKGYEAKGKLEAAKGAFASITNESKYYTQIYVNPQIGYSESFNNQTKQSMFAGMAQQGSDMAKEFAFVLNAADMNVLKGSQENLGKTMGELTSGLGNGGIAKFIQKFTKGASVVASGANLLFPELWSNSEFSKSYSIEIDLHAAYGSKEDIFMNIFVPMWHLVALTAPRQLNVNSYSSPFLVRCFIPGVFNTNMGIVESLNISKGGDGTAWSVDGYPLEMKISMSIKDLYSALAISRINGVSPGDAYNFLNNISLIDYVAVVSGLDLRKSEFERKFDVAKTLAANAFDDLFQYPADTLQESLHTMYRRVLHR